MIPNVMIDIETLGTGHLPVILSIGAAKFDPHGDSINDSFYVAVDPVSCEHFGLKVTASTAMWWMDPERDVARTNMLQESRVDLATALEGFIQWYGHDSLPTWGNGATFDNVIMRSVLDKVMYECPWKFWDDRCYRTLKSMAPSIKIERHGMYHNALDDAVSQALHLQAIYKHLSL